MAKPEFDHVRNRIISESKNYASKEIKKKVENLGKPSKQVVHMEEDKDGKFKKKK